MRLPTHVLALFGLILFGGAFAATFLSPIYFEQAGKQFIQARIETEVRERIRDLPPNLPTERTAGFLAQTMNQDLSRLRKHLEDRLPEKVAAVVAQMLDADCECRKKLARTFRESFEWRITSIQQAQTRLFDIIEGKYVEIVQKLLRELRIFTGTNAVAFLCLAAAASLRNRSGAPLILPAALLLISTVISMYFYLFAQNWFHTIIFNEYVGYGYAAYMGMVFVLLWDITLNGAKITTTIIDAAMNVVGSLVSHC